MIIIKNKEEIDSMKEGGKILANIMQNLVKEIVPGVSTGYLEELACRLISEAGARPAFKGYQSLMEAEVFPTALCASINDEVVHAPALPPRMLKEGDIIGIDIGIEYPYNTNKTGYYTDMAVTVGVGRIDEAAQRLIDTTKGSLAQAIKIIKPGISLNDVSKAIQDCVKQTDFSIVRDLVGHGVGKALHEDPQIPNYEIKGNKKIILKEGMTLAIEPMINMGNYAIKTLDDGFTIATLDGSISAHFEHTIAVTENGYEILTKI